MLIDPVFDESTMRRYFSDEAQDQINIVHDDSQFVVEVLTDGKFSPALGFEKIQTGVFWTDLNPSLSKD